MTYTVSVSYKISLATVLILKQRHKRQVMKDFTQTSCATQFDITLSNNSTEFGLQIKYFSTA